MPSAVRKRKKIKKKLNKLNEGLSKRAQPFLYCIKTSRKIFFRLVVLFCYGMRRWIIAMQSSRSMILGTG